MILIIIWNHDIDFQWLLRDICLKFRSRGHKLTFWNSKSPSGYDEGGHRARVSRLTQTHRLHRVTRQKPIGLRKHQRRTQELGAYRGGGCWQKLIFFSFPLKSAPTSWWPSTGTKVEETLAPTPACFRSCAPACCRSQGLSLQHTPRRSRGFCNRAGGSWGMKQ